jgi:hypothetical protein
MDWARNKPDWAHSTLECDKPSNVNKYCTWKTLNPKTPRTLTKAFDKRQALNPTYFGELSYFDNFPHITYLGIYFCEEFDEVVQSFRSPIN